MINGSHLNLKIMTTLEILKDLVAEIRLEVANGVGNQDELNEVEELLAERLQRETPTEEIKIKLDHVEAEFEAEIDPIKKANLLLLILEIDGQLENR